MLRGRESNRGLGDYANCILQLLGVSDCVFTPLKAGVGVQSLQVPDFSRIPAAFSCLIRSSPL